MFQISFTQATLEDLQRLRAYEQKKILEEIQVHLQNQPAEPTRNRKRLRPNQLAEWELRIDTFRVFYDVDLEATLVKIVAIGYKQGNILFIHGEEYEL